MNEDASYICEMKQNKSLQWCHPRVCICVCRDTVAFLKSWSVSHRTTLSRQWCLPRVGICFCRDTVASIIFLFPFSHKTFAQNNFPSAPDYNKETSWAALPDRKDAADVTPNDSLKDNQPTAKADVFFIYPTSFLNTTNQSQTWNASIDDSVVNKKTKKGSMTFQASVFNGACKVYAPFYRQAIINSFYNPKDEKGVAALDTAYADVKRAFEYYLKNFNHGRPIIIAGHSQGGRHAEQLIKDYFDGKDLSKQLVCAYIVGWGVTDDTFKVIQPCRDANDLTCFVTWNTVAYGVDNSYLDKKFKNIVCTNPLSWKTDSLTVDYEKNPGGVVTDIHKITPAICDATVHHSLLWVHHPHFSGSAFIHWEIYHIMDYNFFYLSIRRNVIERVNEYLKNK